MTEQLSTDIECPGWQSVATWYARIYLAGDIEVAKQVCREECFAAGLCVTVEPCEFIYTGGQESGCCVGLINYPRFPSDPAEITNRAKLLAEILMTRTCQWSVSVVTPNLTFWLTRRKDHEQC